MAVGLALNCFSVLLLCTNFPCHSSAFFLSSSFFSRSSLIFRHATHNDCNEEVHVYDDVFSNESCEVLHDLAEVHAESGGFHGSSIFYRNEERQDVLLTPLECALNSFLDIIQDENDIVEYWSRQEYLNLDAHSDIDEEELEDDGTLRYPEFGHVLYLQKDDDFVAPTIVFSTKLGGWTTAAVSIDNGDDGSLPIVVVPAVQGRVLRFAGSAMHAVPKPATRWLQSTTKVDDDDDDDDYYDERSVILFNTWKGKGPRGVAQDSTTGVLPDGIELDDQDDDNGGVSYVDSEALRKQQKKREWEEDYDVDCKRLWCQSRNLWKRVSIQGGKNNTSSNSVEVCVPLMGGKERRIYPKNIVSLKGSSELEKGLEEERLPLQFHLNSQME